MGGQGTRRPAPDLVAWLREHGSRAERLVPVCTGAILLAEEGSSQKAPAHLVEEFRGNSRFSLT